MTTAERLREEAVNLDVFRMAGRVPREIIGAVMRRNATIARAVAEYLDSDMDEIEFRGVLDKALGGEDV